MSGKPPPLLLPVKVQPRAARERIVGVHGEALKIALNAPPVDGAANRALCALLARELGVAKGAVRVARGQKAREKLVEVAGADPERVDAFRRQWGVVTPSA